MVKCTLKPEFSKISSDLRTNPAAQASIEAGPWSPTRPHTGRNILLEASRREAGSVSAQISDGRPNLGYEWVIRAVGLGQDLGCSRKAVLSGGDVAERLFEVG